MVEQNTYQKIGHILIAVDCIIFGFDHGKLKLLLFKRKVQPFAGSWSLIGSFIKDEESVPNAAQRILKEVTGLNTIYFEELKTYSQVDRDPGGRCISIAQYALIRLDTLHKELVKNYDAQWFELSRIPDLVLDHGIMVQDALQQLRNQVKFYPIGFKLLPKKFTLRQIQSLYEELFQRKLDTRNFRKKLVSLGILKALPEKDKSTSKKGSYLYEFDLKKYNRLLKNGFYISFFKG